MPQPEPLPDNLYHYTDAGGLHGILSGQKLWATHAAYLNDSQEFLYGMQLILDELKQLAGDPPQPPASLPESPEARRELLTTIMPYLMSQALQMHFQQRTEFLRQNAGPFVTCLSAARDQLSQWRGYGAGGGYAIRFDPRALRDSIDRYTPALPTPPLPLPLEDVFGVPVLTRQLVKMEYEPNAQIPVVRERVGEFITEFVDALKTEQLDAEGVPERVKELLFSRLNPQLTAALDLATRLKHNGFQEEKEYRIVTFSPPEFFCPDAIGLIPRVNIQFDPACITEIIIGPGQHTDTRESSVRSYIQVQNNRYSGVEVSRSKIPFTGN